jgi:proteasome lid subunit RPN8/RPN11
LLLNLSQNQFILLKKLAYEESPIEAVALLFGSFSKHRFCLEKVVKVANIKNSKIEFKIDPQIVLKEINNAEKQNLNLIGFFHSHPDLAFPSFIDLQNMKLWLDYVWIIFSLVQDKMGAYVLANDGLKDVKLKITS